MTKHVLVIDGLRPAHKILKKLGAKLTLMSGVDRIKEADSKLYDRIIGMPIDSNHNEWIEVAKGINKIDKIDTICAYHERNQDTAAMIANELNLKSNSLETLRCVYNKFEMRKKLTECGIEDIKFKKVQNFSDIEAFANENGYPLILKPINGWASIGVSKIENRNDINKAVEWFEKWGQGYEMYIEQFIEGKEFSVEVFSENGIHRVICVTEKFKDEKHFVEIGHCLPACIDNITESKIVNYVRNVLNALNIVDGPTHTEIIVTKDGPKIVETHTRLGGDFIPDLIKYASGMDLMELHAKQTLGENVLGLIEEDIFKGKFACIWYCTPNVIGELTKIEGLDLAKSVEGVKAVELLQNPGDELKGVHDSFSRTAYVISTGDSYDLALNSVKLATNELRFGILCKA